MSKEINHKVELSCKAEQAFEAWLDAKRHGDMIDGQAEIDPTLGGKFSIWEDAVIGKTTLVDRGNLQIDQEWRYAYDDWPASEPSKIGLWFEDKGDDNCVLHFTQTDIPEKYFLDIEQGWKDYYWKPMREYFNKS